jgi:hypothetical protein
MRSTVTFLLAKKRPAPQFAAPVAAEMFEAYGLARDHACRHLATPFGEAFVAEGSEGEVHRESRFKVAGRERIAMRDREPGFLKDNPEVIRRCVHPLGSCRAMTIFHSSRRVFRPT